MSEQRWAVLSARPGNGWLVVHPGDVFRYDGILDCADVHSTYSTWAEAMQEADRMARTGTFTLPANPDRVLPVTNIMMSRDPGGIWTERTYRVTGYQEITIPDTCRERVALALLAHARKENN